MNASEPNSLLFDERRWTLGAWLVVGFIVLAALLELLVFGFAATRPTDGCLVNQGTDEAQVVKSCVGGWPTPLRRGDEVLSVEGQSLRLDVDSMDVSPPPSSWVAGADASYAIRRDGIPQTLDVPLQRLDWPAIFRLLVADMPNLLTNIIILVVATTAFLLRPGSAATRLLLLSLAVSVFGQSFSAPSMLISHIAWDFWPSDLHRGFAYLFSLIIGWVTLPALLLLLLRFPREVWPVTRWPRATTALIFGTGFAVSLLAVLTKSFVPFLAVVALYAVLVVTTFIATTIGTVRRGRDPVVRAQTAWLGLGFAISCAQIFMWIATIVFPTIGTWFENRQILTIVVSQTTSLALPVCLAIAILRYRLFDIDVIINRALVYGALTASVIATYVLVVGYLGRMLRVEDDMVVSFVATGIVAVLFQPLRSRLQHRVNRLMYGDRDDPYGVLTGLGRRLEVALARDAMLPTIVAAVTDTLRLPYAAITMRQGDEQVLVAAAGAIGPVSLSLPLTYQGTEIGALHVAPRAGEQLGPQDQRLLADLARQVGVAVHAVQLTAALQRSRERIVTAREEERRRLRRDLHDGLGPRLAGLALRIETARDRLAHDPVADELLDDLSSRLQDAIGDIRRLVYGLRPPALDELGLVGAIRQTAANYETPGLEIFVDAPDPFKTLPAAMEVATFRIVEEALTNVVRHARASRCVVNLNFDDTTDALAISVTDDGSGLPLQWHDGVGFQSMRERAEELGGTLIIQSQRSLGTTILAELPHPSRE